MFHLMLPLLLAASIVSSAVAGQTAAVTKRWADRFNLSACSWSSAGRNDFFILEPGYQEVLEGRIGGEAVRLEITVLNETRKVGGVETRVVEERESRNGEVIEVSRNFFAVCRPGNDVFYFGEEVDLYKNGKIAGHEGSWVAEGGARPGLFMPSRPLLGGRFYQELAPGVAMDRVEIVSDSESVKTPAGEFHDVLRAEETTPLEPSAKDLKLFARGIGIVRDGDLLLTKYGSK
jgi:hypothetical protein